MSSDYDAKVIEFSHIYREKLQEIEAAFNTGDKILTSFLVRNIGHELFEKEVWITIVHAADIVCKYNAAFRRNIYTIFENESLTLQMLRFVDSEGYAWKYLHTAYEYCAEGSTEKIIPFFNRYMKGKCTLGKLLEILPEYKAALQLNGLYQEGSMLILKEILNNKDNRRELGQKLAKHFEGLETALKQLESRLNRLGSKNDDVVLNQNNQSDHLTEIKLQALIAFYNKYKWDIPKAQRLPHGHWDFLALNTNNQQNGGFFITGNVYNTPEIFHIRYQGTNRIVHIYPKNETHTFQTFDEIVQFLNQRFP